MRPDDKECPVCGFSPKGKRDVCYECDRMRKHHADVYAWVTQVIGYRLQKEFDRHTYHYDHKVYDE